MKLNRISFSAKALTFVALGLAPMQAHAADIFKAANADDLSLSSSWTMDYEPTAADTAWFDTSIIGVGAHTYVLGADRTWQQLRVDREVGSAPGGSVIISGGNTLTLGTGGILLNSVDGASLQVDCNLVLGGSQGWANNTGVTYDGGGIPHPNRTLVINGAVDLGANTLTTELGGTSWDPSIAINGAIGGSGKLSVLGIGTLSLTGNNTYSGGTDLGAGTYTEGVVLVGHSNALGTGQVMANGIGIGASVAGLDLQNAISVGAGGLWVTGDHDFTLSGPITIGNATRYVNNDSASGITVTLGNIDLSAGASSRVNFSYGKFLVNGIISGLGSLELATASPSLPTQVTLAGANTYSGGTWVGPQSTLVIGGAGTLGATTSSLVVSGGILDLGTTTQTVGAVTLANGGLIRNGKLVATSFVSTGGTASANLSGAGATFTHESGTTILSGSNNYLGATTVTAGTLQFAQEVSLYRNTTSMWKATSLIVQSGATATFNVGGTGEFTAADIDIIKGIGTTDGGFRSGSSLGLDTTNAASGNFTYATPIADTNGGLNSLGLVKSGPGTLTLEGVNTYTGKTTINGGTLRIDGAGQLGGGTYAGAISNAGTLVYNSTAAQTLSGVISGTGALVKSNTGTLTLSGSNTYTGGTTINGGTLTIVGAGQLGGGTYAGAISNSGTLNYNSTAAQTLSGVISGTGNLVKSNTGILTLSGANTYAGGTTINGGTLAISQDANLGAPSGTLTFSGNSTLRLNASLTSARGVNLSAGGTSGTIDTNGYAQTFSGVISGVGGLTKTGIGTLTLSGVNTYTGGTTINGGTFEVGGAGQFGGGTYAGAINLNNGATLSYNSTADQTLFGNISGGGFLVKDNTGTLTVLGSNTYTGGTTIGSGTLAISGAGQLGGGTYNAYILNNGTLNYNSTADQALYGPISGTGTLVKGNAGTLTLWGLNAYTGNTTIHGGTLAISGTSKLGVGAYAGAISNAGILHYNSSAAQTLSGVISGTGSLVKGNTGTLTLSGANTYTGVTTISGGTLEIGGAGQLGGGTYAGAISNAGTLSYNSSAAQTLSGVISGTGSLVKGNTGTLTLAGSNTYTGGTTIGSGTLAISGAGQLGGGTYAGDINNAGTLEYNSTAVQNLSGAISGTGALVKGNTGTLTLSGTSAYNGSTTVQSGRLAFARRNSLYNASSAKWTAENLIVNAGATASFYVGGPNYGFSEANIDIIKNLGTSTGGFMNGSILGLDTSSAGSFTYNTAITNTNGGANSIGFSKLGTGTLLLGGANTYTGPTKVEAGTLLVNGSLSASSTTVLSGATFGGTGSVRSVTLLDNATLAPGSNGKGILTVNGDVTSATQSAIVFEIGGTARGTGYDALLTTGVLMLDGSIQIVAASGFDTRTLGSGSTFDLMDWGTLNAAAFNPNTDVNTSAAPLASNLYWDTSDLLVDGSISVGTVPEPSSAALLALGLLLIPATQRRRRR